MTTCPGVPMALEQNYTHAPHASHARVLQQHCGWVQCVGPHAPGHVLAQCPKLLWLLQFAHNGEGPTTMMRVPIVLMCTMRPPSSASKVADGMTLEHL